MAHTPPRSSNGEVAAVVQVARAVAVLGRFIDNLGGKNKQEDSDQQDNKTLLPFGTLVLLLRQSNKSLTFAFMNKDHTGVQSLPLLFSFRALKEL